MTYELQVSLLCLMLFGIPVIALITCIIKYTKIELDRLNSILNKYKEAI